VSESPADPGPTPAVPLDRERRSAMLAMARQAIRDWVESGRNPQARSHGGASARRLSLFVTLRKQGELRGCIGLIETDLSLEEAVRECAVSAANDPRFEPLSRDEAESTRIEISILDGWKEIHGPGEIEVGRHGLMITRGSRRGLLLPQVAVEQGWDAGRFLEEVCSKALLPRDAWRSGGLVSSFTAEVFGERDPLPEAE
jgi:AmmeMemoRadiSam system protein A